MKPHWKSIATSKSPRFSIGWYAEASMVSIFTLSPIWRHWSTSQIAIGS